MAIALIGTTLAAIMLIPSRLLADEPQPKPIPAHFVSAPTGDLVVLRFALGEAAARQRTVFLYDISVPRPGIYCAEGALTIAVQALAREAQAFVEQTLAAADSIEVHNPRPGPRKIWFAQVSVAGTPLGALLEREGLGQRIGPEERHSWCTTAAKR